MTMKRVFAILAGISLSVGSGTLLLLFWMDNAYAGAASTIAFGLICWVASKPDY